jgi:hypothetical protein
MVGITGYYRYTDIWFYWAAEMPGDDGAILKAALGKIFNLYFFPVLNTADQPTMLFVHPIILSTLMVPLASLSISVIHLWSADSLIPICFLEALSSTEKRVSSSHPSRSSSFDTGSSR